MPDPEKREGEEDILDANRWTTLDDMAFIMAEMERLATTLRHPQSEEKP